MICPLCHEKFPVDPQLGGNCGTITNYGTEDNYISSHYQVIIFPSSNLYGEIITIPPFRIINENNISEIFICRHLNNDPTLSSYVWAFLTQVPKIEICQPDLLLSKIRSIITFL